jgi:hypothetical protein
MRSRGIPDPLDTDPSTLFRRFRTPKKIADRSPGRKAPLGSRFFMQPALSRNFEISRNAGLLAPYKIQGPSVNLRDVTSSMGRILKRIRAKGPNKKRITRPLSVCNAV